MKIQNFFWSKIYITDIIFELEITLSAISIMFVVVVVVVFEVLN